MRFFLKRFTSILTFYRYQTYCSAKKEATSLVLSLPPPIFEHFSTKCSAVCSECVIQVQYCIQSFSRVRGTSKNFLVDQSIMHPPLRPPVWRGIVKKNRHFRLKIDKMDNGTHLRFNFCFKKFFFNNLVSDGCIHNQ